MAEVLLQASAQAATGKSWLQLWRKVQQQALRRSHWCLCSSMSSLTQNAPRTEAAAGSAEYRLAVAQASVKALLHPYSAAVGSSRARSVHATQEEGQNLHPPKSAEQRPVH